ncbi:hypothetical protein IFM89_016726 [Coptis chinensis]|uniref:Transcriptional coactivator Hfi1/Transcriptional adapter 1 n=1 Tax=Coptis chinensis TaxID=261450 RepID=A0A835M9C8_9MAGN|nr:hypothetical protein IFM89_016726 [Coptis chinensis]
MPPYRHSSRTDTLELKAQIVSNIGSEKAEKYFNYISRFLRLKLTKFEFNKLCISTIGRENISLHNRFIGSIVKNACTANTPPWKGSKGEGSLNGKVTNGYHGSNLQLLYGDAFPLSPRRGRSSNVRDRKYRDRPSPLGPNGKVHNIMYDDESVPKTQEKQSVCELVSPSSGPRFEVVSVEDGEEAEPMIVSPSVERSHSVNAPLGIYMNPRGARKTLRRSFLSALHPESMCNSYELPDTLSLKKQLERKLESEGLGISVDCANILNNALDTFVKRMIKPCLELARSRNVGERLKQVSGHNIPDDLHILSTNKSMQRSKQCISASLLDFRVAMELQPSLLGENWPVHLERVCLRASEE